MVRADDRVLREGDAVVAGDDDDVGQAESPERGPELAAAAVYLVGGRPGDPQPGCHQAFRLRDGQFRLRCERQLLRDPRLLPALRVLGPAVRHVHIEIGPGLPEGGDQDGEHPGHAILHLARHAGMLRRHARGEFPFPQVSGLIKRQSRPSGIAGILAQDFLRQPRPDQVIRVIRQDVLRQARQQPAEFLPRPLIAAEQGLQPVRPLMPGPQGQLPAVRPRLPRQRPDVIQRRRDGAPLPHDPAQQVADQRVCSLAALGGIIYAGHRGRGRVLFSHKSRNVPRPRRIARPHCPQQLPVPATDRYISRIPGSHGKEARKHPT